jgi:murein lipoprotein
MLRRNPISFRTNVTTQGNISMKFATTLKVAVAAVGFVALAACQDLKPLQASIDDLKAQVSAVKSDVAKAQGDASAASSAAAAASQSASGAQSTANQALSAAQASQSCCDSTNEKIDRMFKKSVSK